MRFFLIALTILFITLKLLDKIDWSWWLVLSPILTLLAITIIAVGYASYKIVDAQERRIKRTRGK